MAAPTSAVPRVKGELVRLLAARPGLHDVEVSYGWPHPADMPDLIALLDAEEHTQRPAGSRGASAHPREEDFDLQVLVIASMTGVADHRPVTERAYQLLAELEDELRDDMTLNTALGNGWAQVKSAPLQEFGPSPELRRESWIDARVHCKARI